MPQENTTRLIQEPLSQPDMLRVAFREILFIGELHMECQGGDKKICMFLQDKIILCQDLTPSTNQYLIEGMSCMIRFGFDLKFENIYSNENFLSSNIIGVRLLKKEHSDFKFYFTEKQSDKLHVLHILRKFLSQIGFHQLFKPLKKLGAGNFATVFEVKRYEDNKKFAVKAFSKKHLFSTPKGKQSIINELNVLRFLNHKNVIKMEGVFESENSLYVLLELIHGQHFFNALRHMETISFSSTQISQFMKNLLEGLRHLHSQRIMHRDLKPENIMLRNGRFEEPIIVDFGLGTNCDVEEYLFYRCGTPGYIAPEIIALRDNKKHIEPICDIFSAGAIFHILLTGKVLFEGNEFDEVYEKNKRMQIFLNEQEIIEKAKNCYAYDLLVRMLERDPNSRITAEEALEHPFFNQKDKQVFSSPQTQVSKNQYEKQGIREPRLLRF